MCRDYPFSMVFVFAALCLLPLPGTARAAPGDLDLSFNGGAGWMTVRAGYGAADIALQPDGKIVLAGRIFDSTGFGRARLAVWRLLPDGSLDSTFNGTGQTVAELPGNLESFGSAVAVQSDGRIVVAGASWEHLDIDDPPTPNNLYTLACFLPDGRPDPAFGPNGQGFHRSSVRGVASSIALQPDGKILAGGSYYFVDSSALLWRCLPTASPIPPLAPAASLRWTPISAPSPASRCRATESYSWAARTCASPSPGSCPMANWIPVLGATMGMPSSV